MAKKKKKQETEPAAPKPVVHRPFEALAEHRAKLVPPLPPPAAKKTVPAQTPAQKEELSDEALWAEAISSVRERPEFRQKAEEGEQGPRRLKPVRAPVEDEEAVMRELEGIVRRRGTMRLADTAEYVSWSAPGMREDLPDRLHEGEFSVQDHIDLHGYTEEEAVEGLAAFIAGARREGLRCVKVIHGRGLRSPAGPVLKGAVIRMLKGPLSKHTAAFCTARSVDGGLGAMYVLLR